MTIFVDAQIYYSKSITSNEGLPDNAIRAIFKDSRGFLWIGTDGGLCKWDGSGFKKYNTLDGLAGNKIWWIDEDSSGNLWFACYGGGVSKYDGLSFRSYTGENSGLTDNYVRVVKYDPYHDCIAIGTNHSISVLQDSVFYNFSQNNKKLPDRAIITGITLNDSCISFFNFHSKSYCVYFKNDKPVLEKTGKKSLGKYRICSAFKTKSGISYFGWKRKGVIKQTDTGFLEIPNIGQVFEFAEDFNHDLWLASWNGAGISPPGGLFLLHNDKVKQLNKHYGFKSIRGWSVVTLENQNLILYGTIDDALHIIPPRYFEYFLPEYFNEKELYLKDIAIDTNNVFWFITKNKLFRWNSDTLLKKRISKIIELCIDYEHNCGNINRNRINRIVKRKVNLFFNDIAINNNNNNVFITVLNLGLIKIDNYNNVKYAGYNTSRQNLVFGRNDTLFTVNKWGGVFEKSLDNQYYKKFINYGSHSLINISGKKICCNKDEVWTIGDTYGVFLYKNGILKDITKEDTALNRQVNDICFDEEGYVFLGGSDGRIEILAPKTREKFFTLKQTGERNPVQWIKVSKGMLFVGYTNGLKVFKLHDLKSKKQNYLYYSSAEGYAPGVVNSSAVDKKGNIWLATNNGLVKINTLMFERNYYKPLKTIISKVEIFGQPVDWNKYSKINPWTQLPESIPRLSYDHNNITFYFSTLNYGNPRADNYYYKLEGGDKGWSGPSNKKYVVYPNLPPGKYKFLVKSKNKNSGLFSNEASFEFVILTPWYKTLIFYIIIVFVLLGLVFLFYHMRLKEMKERENAKRKVMQQISELETKALQAQMNPHFLFNSLNSIQNYILDNDVDEALEYLNSFSRIIRMTLEFVDKKFIPLSDELIYLEYYVSLEKMRFDNVFSYEVSIGNKIEPECTLIPPMLLQPLIENAIKHGIIHLKNKHGKIKLEIIKTNNKSFQCIIEDNGIGREKSMIIEAKQKNVKRSKGLNITKERLRMLNEKGKTDFKLEVLDLYNKTGQPVGTRVKITLPLMLE